VNLKDWPRPPGDNGVGVHAGRATIGRMRRNLPILKELHIKWVVLADNDPSVVARAANFLYAQGIMPLVRKQAPVDGRTQFRYVAAMCDSPYFLIFNEPGDDRQYNKPKPDNWWDIFRNKWVRQAYGVRSVGKYPGLQLMDLSEYHDMLTWMKEEGHSDLFGEMWMAPHIYPPLGCPPDCTEHGVFDMLGIRDYASVCEDVVGFVMPQIMTETAWTPDQAPPEVRAKWVVQVFEQFKYGKMADGSDLPDWFFGVCFWILDNMDWYGFSWLDNPPEHGATVEAVKAMGDWVRGQGEAPEPEPEPEPLDARLLSPWMTLEDAADKMQALAEAGYQFTIERR